MKVKSTFKNYAFMFDFFVESVTSIENETKRAFVATKAYTLDKQLLWEGQVRVDMNEFGIFPFPEDINSIEGTTTMKKMLLVELRRYIKPQKPFL
ncbi:hypothetical protein [Peribacillus glennii]|uniref:Uncharacterized protein n=1 Tax=Peribacillus glennii TaxID=2303991 RepID=A0A372LGH7_9BACI|nr:hypothetical protein [Peribacillus glennii]RFU65401.1 hypothetical protein D0466_05785 [Peribacillus glennii]